METKKIELKFTAAELNSVVMALQCLVEDMSEAIQDPNFTIEGRLTARDLVKTAMSAKRKIQDVTGIPDMDDYKPGGEDGILNFKLS